MGGSSSQAADLPALPEQRIVNVRDGQAEVVPEQPPIGSTKQAVAVRPGLSLQRGALQWEAGRLQVELLVKDAGHVELLMPGVEIQREQDWPRYAAAESQPTRQSIRQRVSVSSSPKPQSITFECPSLEGLHGGDHKGGSIWPIVWPCILVLRPGPAAELDVPPPDGTMLAFCRVQGQRLVVVRQVIAWGGDGKAFEMKDMFGLQDAKASEDLNSSQRLCVICLTSPRDTALLPCSHFCVCYDCGLSIRLTPSRATCPLCRRDVKDLVSIDCAK